MAMPGMSSRLSRFYQYTAAEQAELNKKKRARDVEERSDEPSATEEPTANNSSTLAPTAGLGNGGGGGGGGGGNGGGGGGRTQWGQDDYVTRKPMDLSAAIKRPFGESFLWSAGYDPARPPLGGKPLGSGAAAAAATASTVRTSSSRQYCQHTAKELVLEAVRRRVTEEAHDASEAALSSSSSSSSSNAATATAATVIPVAMQLDHDSSMRLEKDGSSSGISGISGDGDSGTPRARIPLVRSNSSSFSLAAGPGVAKPKEREDAKPLGDRRCLRREQAHGKHFTHPITYPITHPITHVYHIYTRHTPITHKHKRFHIKKSFCPRTGLNTLHKR